VESWSGKKAPITSGISGEEKGNRAHAYMRGRKSREDSVCARKKKLQDRGGASSTNPFKKKGRGEFCSGQEKTTEDSYLWGPNRGSDCKKERRVRNEGGEKHYYLLGNKRSENFEKKKNSHGLRKKERKQA